MAWHNTLAGVNPERRLLRADGLPVTDRETLAVTSACETPYPGDTGYAIESWLIEHETFYVLKDPQTTDCEGKIPFGITELRFALYYPEIACTADVTVEIYDAEGIICPKPGALLYESPTLEVAADDGPQAVTFLVDLLDTVCVHGPFFVGLTFLDGSECFQLFTDQDSAACGSYAYLHDTDTLMDLAEVGFPGQLWMQAIGLDSAQSNCPPEADFYTIPEVYDNIAALDGQTVTVFGEFVSNEDSKLVTEYGDYMANELMPPSSILFLDGVLPDPDFWYGGVMLVTGTISTAPEPYVIYPSDTLQITITAISYEYIYHGYGDAQPQSEEDDLGEALFKPAADCDPCKFAILISGGGNAANNKAAYWDNIEALYKHKTKDSDASGGGYCPENVKVIYFDGNSKDTTAIANAAVASATEANIQAAHDEIAKKVAQCERDGKDATVQKLVTNHGSNDAGAWLLGEEYLSPEELRAMQQTLIDSCCDFMYDEFIECYGGDMVNGLKEIDDKGKTEVHGNSAAGANTVGWSGGTGVHEYLKKKIARLEAGDSYETAVDSARNWYRTWLQGWADRWKARGDSLKALADTLPAGPMKTALIGKSQQDSVRAAEAQESNDEAGPSFVRYQFKEYCEWKKIVCPPGGQFGMEFKGTGGCGNVSVYKQKADGSKERVKTFNWTLPNSVGYQPGYNRRYVNVDSTGGTYWIHNDNGEFTVTVSSSVKQDSTESTSNEYAYAGGSCGGLDGSYGEFGMLTLPEHVTSGTFSDGFNLWDVPYAICPWEGVGCYIAQFDIAEFNEYWGDMELCIEVLQVNVPGQLVIYCPLAAYPETQLHIDAPGRYLVHLGSFTQRATGGEVVGEIHFDAATDSVSFMWDSWGLRSLVETSLDVEDDWEPGVTAPFVISLEQNYPNPFNPSTVIRYSLARPGEVRLDIYNILGQRVRHFVMGNQRAGTHELAWDGRDNRGRELPSGVYLYKLSTGEFSQTRKMLLLK